MSITDFCLDRAEPNYVVMDWLFQFVLKFTSVSYFGFSRTLWYPRVSTDKRPFVSWESECCGFKQCCAHACLDLVGSGRSSL